MEDTGVDEDSTELPTLEKLVCPLEEEIVGVKHDHPLVIHQAPSIELVHRQLEPFVEIDLRLVWVIHILHPHHLRSVFPFPAPETQINHWNSLTDSLNLNFKGIIIIKYDDKLRCCDFAKPKSEFR